MTNLQISKDPRVKLIKHAVLSNHSASINCVKFSENGEFIATGSLDKVTYDFIFILRHLENI